MQLKPDSADALYLLRQGLLRSGDNAGAIAEWRKAIEVRPDFSEALYNLSLYAKSDPEEAKRLQNQFERLQAQEHITDRAQPWVISRWHPPTRTIGHKPLPN